MEGRVGRIGTERRVLTCQALPRPARQAEEVSRRRGAGSRVESRRHGALHEPVDEVEVTRRVQRGDHASGPLRVPRTRRRGAAGRRARSRGPPRGRGRVGDRGAPRLRARDAEQLATEPAQLVAQRKGPLGVEQRAERPEVGAQPPRSDARLVHSFRVVADARRSGRPRAVVGPRRRASARTTPVNRSRRVPRRPLRRRSSGRSRAFFGVSLHPGECELLEPALRFDRRLAGDLAPGAFGRQFPRPDVVGQVDVEDLVQAGLQRGVGRPVRSASTRRSRLRGIRSAEPMRYSALRSPSLPNRKMRECSR